MKERWDLIDCGTDRSIRYHERREAYFERFEATAAVMGLITSSATVIALAGGNESGMAKLFSALAAILGLLCVVTRPATKAALHARLKQRFIDLRIKYMRARETEILDDLVKLEIERLDIEREEPPIYRALDIEVHNEWALATGRNSENDLYRLPWWQKVTAHMVHWNTNSVPSLAAYNAKRAR